MKTHTGKLITFEGSEGSGKSTQIRLLYAHLRRKKKKVLFLREPGGVKISERVREILLNVKSEGMSNECETLLYMAARAQLVEEVIKPALKAGKIILCDRYLDSTIAYQGYGNGVDIAFIKALGRFATQGITPDLTFVFDIDARKGLSRIHRRKDRIERRSLVYHKKVRQGYLALARKEPARIKLIPGGGSRETIQASIRQHIGRKLGL